MNIIMFSAFILYFVILTTIGLYFYRRMKTAQDFIIGNRSINFWVTAIATQASDMGNWLFLGLPAAVYINGLFEAWAAIGLVSFMFLNWHFIAPKLRALTEDTQTITLSSFFEKQFNDTDGHIRIASAFASLIFFTFYIASSLVGLGRLFESAFEMSYHGGVVLGLSTAILYTLIGGFIAVAWCDLFQGLFLLCMIVLVPTIAFLTLDGISSITTAAYKQNVTLSLLTTPIDTLNALLLAAGWGLGYFGQPHILINFMGIDNPKKITAAKIVGISWQILVLTSSVAIGLVGLAFFSTPLTNPELVFILMTKILFHPFIAGLVLCAILAATLSTMDSHILISGSVIASDVYKKIFNHTASNKKILFLSRLGSLIISFIALCIAWHGTATIYGLVNYAWSGLGSSFGPLVIASLYSKNITRQGALTGLIVGGLTSALWPYFNESILPLIPGFIFNFASMYAVSYFTQKK